ncbi:MAG: cob(I)yrinic acid a,c-diamide adenosyltransferase [Planctomycetota bacterium]
MVRLSKIYTKTGDTGTTMLGDGSTVPKASLRVEAYGTVDEANAAIGLAMTAIDDEDIKSELREVQNDLFDVGADLCVPATAEEEGGSRLRVLSSQAERLEKAIDRHNAHLKPLSSFILPGGCLAASHLHLARCVVRRAERLVAHLMLDEPDRINSEALIYLNRLSDLLFVLARLANVNAGGDVLWVPGASREDQSGE